MIEPRIKHAFTEMAAAAGKQGKPEPSIGPLPAAKHLTAGTTGKFLENILCIFQNKYILIYIFFPLC